MVFLLNWYNNRPFPPIRQFFLISNIINEFLDLRTLNNIRCGASRHFGNKKKEYLKDKINELAMNSKNKNNLQEAY
jgi:hypothetical protein